MDKESAAPPPSWADIMTPAMAAGGLWAVERRIREAHRIMRREPYDLNRLLILTREIALLVVQVERTLVDGWQAPPTAGDDMAPARPTAARHADSGR